MPTLVRDDGSLNARLVLIGEAPGAQEEAQGLPFVGPSGWRLQEWWRAVGLRRTDFYITNVYPYRPANNKIESIPPHELAPWVDALHDRLAALADPWVIVPTGNTALRALTGKSKILKHRGSIYEYRDRRGRTIKVIPTVHPAATFRTPEWERRCRHDWRRIADDAGFRECRLPVREHATHPTLADLDDIIEQASRAEALAFDIETPGGHIVCIACSIDPSWSVTVPLTAAAWGSPARAAKAWDAVRRLLTLPVPKVTQNGHYDFFWLADEGVAPTAWQWDALAEHHALDPTDNHGLAYMASIDSREPYWKDDAKSPDEAAKYASNLDALYVYNGKDACVTLELANLYAARLAAQGRLRFYERHYRDLFEPILAVMREGLRVDEHLRRRMATRVTGQCIAIQDQLSALCGAPLHTTARNKKRAETGKLPGLSNVKVNRYLYEHLALPKQYARRPGGTRSVTANEVAVRRLMLKFGDQALSMPVPTPVMTALGVATGTPPVFRDVGNGVLDFRRKMKLLEFLDGEALDADGRLRSTYKFTTDTGRLASQESPRGTGRNAQNIDRELRGVYLPNDGCVFLECDLSQGEDRIVKMLAAAVTGNDALRERARAMPWENDEHKRAAALLFPGYKDWRDVPSGNGTTPATGLHRYIGKRVRHATSYDMHGLRLADELLKEGLVLTPEEATRMIEAIHAADPDIHAWHRAVRATVLEHRCLVNTWGRMLGFDYERLDDEVFRRAYAFEPQSTLADLLNRWGFVPVWQHIRDQKLAARINAQGHDSLLISVPPHEVYDLMVFVKRSLERPRRIGGEPLVIPVEFKLGKTWAGDVEYKRFPAREDVENEARRLVR